MEIRKTRLQGIIVYVFLALCCLSCSQVLQDSNIYSDTNLWFDNGKEIDASKADIFYILPTCVFDWQKDDGSVCHYASLTDESQRNAMLPSYKLADEIFADSANFFAPYYRHISLNTWMEGDSVVNERFPFAINDVRNAFNYYLQHQNNGRPFVLAGFSQGAKCVVELIKEMDDATASKMVAAYVCGYRVTKEDINASSHIRPALKADDTGVIIAYNTVASTSAINPVICSNNEYVINLASWTTDTISHCLNDSVSIKIDNTAKVLIANGINAQNSFVSNLSSLFPIGNFHLQELTLYQEQLRENVKLRIRSYNLKHP
ncbi:MAG: DUF3089 domain-containing protein [Prevotellaceae bacterium]|nr:DUF3089 domain-containing protein [Candidatus Minthosoma caballi]